MNKNRRTLYKEHRRKWEFDLIAREINKLIALVHLEKPSILEFGSGPSGGAAFLSKIGSLTVSDISRHPLLELPAGVEFCLADIHNTHFDRARFDILVSNQVLEHLERLEVAFQEMQRITKQSGYYFFAVPTATWLIFTIPGQIFKKGENLADKIWKKFGLAGAIDRKKADSVSQRSDNDCQDDRDKIRKKDTFIQKLRIVGHGCYPDFMRCFNFFRVKSWRGLLVRNGFEIVGEKSLLAYGSSHFPIMPTNRVVAKCGFASSYLFVCQHKGRKGC